MSISALQEYARRCAEDAALRDTARKVGLLNIDGHVELAASLGLYWTVDDLIDYQRDVVDAQGGVDELSEEELEWIAGGSQVTSVSSAVGIVAGTASGTSTATAMAAASHTGGW